tara:strand:+ start:6586 stop:6921 length:336 start_codon:yes stop_codon:yes gene_type:complete
LKTNSLKLKIAIICISTLVLVTGATKNPLFILIAFCYIGTMTSVYYFGSRIKDIAINVGYIWLSKWALFTFFLAFTGAYTPDIFLYALTLFIVFNIFVNPTSFMLNNKASQ